MRLSFVVVLLLAGCRTVQPVAAPASAATAPSAPAAAATTTAPARTADATAASDAATGSAARPSPPSEPELVLAGEGCRYTKSALTACEARGKRCRLAPAPQPSPCAGRGARCLEPPMPPPGFEVPCACTCSDEYQRRLEETRDTTRDPDCSEVVDLSTGKKRTVCREPELPR